MYACSPYLYFCTSPEINQPCFCFAPTPQPAFSSFLPSLCPAAHSYCYNSFCVGQVKATEQLRVSSTAPYFVDDRLHCPEAGMRDSKPLHLCVSLAPKVASLTPTEQPQVELAVESAQSASPKKLTRSRTTMTHGAGTRVVIGDHPVGGERGPEHPAGAPADETVPTIQPQKAASGSPPTPWVLDICLVSLKEHLFWPAH